MSLKREDFVSGVPEFAGIHSVMNEKAKLVEEELMRDQQFLDISVLE